MKKQQIKKSVAQTFTLEGELNFLVERGDWELVLTSKAFEKRSQESQAQLVSQAIDNRINQLGKTLNYLVNRGEDHHAAAMGVLERKKEIEHIRDEILKKIYEQYPHSIPEKAGVRMEF